MVPFETLHVVRDFDKQRMKRHQFLDEQERDYSYLQDSIYMPALNRGSDMRVTTISENAFHVCTNWHREIRGECQSG